MFNGLFNRVIRSSPWHLALLAGAGVQILFLICLSWLYVKASEEQFNTIRMDVARLSSVIAQEVDGDLHQQLTSTVQTGSPLYRQVIAPLVRAHKIMPDVYYLYTMVRKNGSLYFVLDTAVYADELDSPYKLRDSKVMERFDTVNPEDQAMFAAIDAGEPYVYRTPYNDPFGTFISGMAPIKNSKGQVVAMLGMDISADELARRMIRIKQAYYSSLGISVLLSLLVMLFTYRARHTAAKLENERMQSEQSAQQHARRTELIINSIMDGVLGLGRNSDILTMSSVAANIWQVDTEQCLHRSFCELLDGPDQPAILAAIEQADKGQHSQLQVQGVREGEVFPMRLVISPGLEGEDARYVVTARDLSRDMALEDDLHLAAQVFSNMNDAVVITDARGIILMVNDAFSRITGYSSDEVKGRSSQILQSDRQDSRFYLAMWQRIEQTGQWQGELYNRRKNGEIYPLALSVKALRDRHGQLARMVNVFTDITLRKEQEQRLHDLANKDALTGLPNRATFASNFEQLLADSRRHGQGIALLLLDVDGFKRINETLGHAQGDQLLKQLAERLQTLVVDHLSLARMSGDRFALLMPTQEPTDVLPLVNRILAEEKQPYLLNEQEVTVSVSVGISRYPNDGQDRETLYKQADIALFEAKSTGSNSYQFFTTAMHVRAMERMTLEAQLHHALARHEMRLVYQPQVCIRNGRLMAMEALLRWAHPEWGDIEPERFIPVAEESGVINALMSWTLEQVCLQLHEWDERNIRIPRVSINLSARQFIQRGQLQKMLAAALERHGLQAERLELEVKESLLTDAAPNVQSTLQEIKALGVQLLIDDFGTGQASLHDLQQLSLQRLKIDQSLIEKVMVDSKTQSMIKAIVQMGHALGIKVIAEGVETAEQLITLQQYECDGVQGFLYSPPMEGAEVESFYQQFQLAV